MHKILIVEDDATIATTIAQQLQIWGYETQCVQNFHNVLQEFIAFGPQLVIMDISLPFFNGYHWCGELRKVSAVPVIFLSSAADNLNIVLAMNMGGDDFIAKPFDLNVLIAKVQAMLRRAYHFSGQGSLLEHGGVILDVTEASLRYQGRKLDLTKNELKVLQLLMESPGKPVSRDAMMLRLWENDSFVDENALSVGIARLRKKLDTVGLGEFILTKKGIGYMVV